jgi:NitT/TauT family transport system permease protein
MVVKKERNRFIIFKLIISIILLWLLISSVFDIPEYKLPKINDVYNVFISNFNEIVKDFSITLLESFIGFVLSVMFGIIIAFNLSLSKKMEGSMLPIIVALQSVPVVAFAPILFVWFGFSFMTKIILSIMISIFPVILNVYKGLSYVGEDDIEFFNSIKASKKDIFIHLRVPNAVPYFINSLKISAPLASVGAIVSEFTGAKSGLGFRLLISQYRSDIPSLFLYTLLASFLGIILFKIASLAEIFFKKYFYEYEEL